MCMKVIVFSWVGNTGKTSAIDLLRSSFLEKDPNARILVLHETAIEYISKIWLESVDRKKMQAHIAQTEKERIDFLVEMKRIDHYDYVLVDRTYVDGLLYTYWNVLLWHSADMNYYITDKDYKKISKDLYDHIIFFSQPIKPDLLFQDYNHQEFGEIFYQTIQFIYWEKVLLLDNSIQFSNNREKYIALFN